MGKNQEPRTKNQKPRTKNQEPGTAKGVASWSFEDFVAKSADELLESFDSHY